jgi:hypothetical protein
VGDRSGRHHPRLRGALWTPKSPWCQLCSMWAGLPTVLLHVGSQHGAMARSNLLRGKGTFSSLEADFNLQVSIFQCQYTVDDTVGNKCHPREGSPMSPTRSTWTQALTLTEARIWRHLTGEDLTRCWLF